MKVKDFIEQLQKAPQDFELKANIIKEDNSDYGIHLETFKVDWIWDIWQSDGIVILSLKED